MKSVGKIVSITSSCHPNPRNQITSVGRTKLNAVIALTRSIF